MPTNLNVGRFAQFAFDNKNFKWYTQYERTLHSTTHIYHIPVQTPRSSLWSPRKFLLKEIHPRLKDRQKSRSLVKVERSPLYLNVW